jgi:carbon monoxide dehydrogenase subunit G
MRLSKQFDVDRSRDVAVSVLDHDDTICGLFPDTLTEIVEVEGDRKTIVSHYRALGREGDATFHFDFLMDGSVRFEKVCDGNVWRQLRGEVRVEDLGEDRARVEIEMDGRTKSFVPEFTIKGPMTDQIEQMARALKLRIEAE